MSSDDTNDDQKKGFISRVIDTFYTVPCVRDAYLYGIAGGLAAGLNTFMFSSNARRATNVGVLAFAVIMPGCLFQNFKKEKEQERARPPTYVPWRPDESSDHVTDDNSKS